MQTGNQPSPPLYLSSISPAAAITARVDATRSFGESISPRTTHLLCVCYLKNTASPILLGSMKLQIPFFYLRGRAESPPAKNIQFTFCGFGGTTRRDEDARAVSKWPERGSKYILCRVQFWGAATEEPQACREENGEKGARRAASPEIQLPNYRVANHFTLALGWPLDPAPLSFLFFSPFFFFFLIYIRRKSESLTNACRTTFSRALFQNSFQVSRLLQAQVTQDEQKKELDAARAQKKAARVE